MKTIKTKYLFIAFAIMIMAVSCTTNFLEVKPSGTNLENAYYKNQAEAYSGLVAVYDVMRKSSGGLENTISILNAVSDDHYAGGGGPTDGIGIQAASTFTQTGITIPGSYWSDYYQGIFRANYLLTKLPGVPMDANLIARYTAESKALRAYYYFNLVKMFKNIPLITVPLTSDQFLSVPQADPAAVFAQIEKDLTEAIAVLPSSIDIATEAGRFSKGAVIAILGKVYLTEGKSTLAAAQFALVNGTPGATSPLGYKLLANYKDLWVVSNKYNSESILETNHTSTSNAGWGNWGSGSDEGNSLNVMVGPRGYTTPAVTTAPNLPSGWSYNPITQDLYDFIKSDPRFAATVLDMKALKAAKQADYIPGYKDTGYFLNKFIPRQTDVSTGGGDTPLNYKQDTYDIRLADTYLLEAEALGSTGSRAQALLDAVRARVGLPSVAVSAIAVANERRLELAGEGHRFFDLVRTGKAATVLASRGFTAGKSEIFPIPYLELTNTLIKQNPGYN
jgi:hypothetical protein